MTAGKQGMPAGDVACNLEIQNAPKRKGFVRNESYMHDAAKTVVASWFRNSQDSQGCVRIGNVSARTNRIGGYCGVYEEYPIGTKGEGISPCWDEHPKHVWASEFLSKIYGEPILSFPSYESLVGEGVKPKCICDVVLIHKGAVSTAIEIVHKHPTPDWKREFLASHDIGLVEVQAEAVLHFTKCPEQLPLYVPRVKA